MNAPGCWPTARRSPLVSASTRCRWCACSPDAHVTWLLVSLDPADGDTAYGLIDLGIGMPSLGTVRLSDLAGIVGPRKLPLQRDRYFQAVRPLSEYVRLAQENDAITD